jgi:hypothetical protein
MSEPFVLDAEFADAVHRGLKTKLKNPKPSSLGCSCFIVAFTLPTALFMMFLLSNMLFDDWTALRAR